jgi:hypothetical protein
LSVARGNNYQVWWAADAFGLIWKNEETLELIRKENGSEDLAKQRISNRPLAVDSGTLLRYNLVGTPRADYPAELPHLEHRFTFWPAPALNRTNILGAGSFITIPLLISALGGPQSFCWAGC